VVLRIACMVIGPDEYQRVHWCTSSACADACVSRPRAKPGWCPGCAQL